MTCVDRPFITVVSGLPRSGTSMLMRMLEAGGMPVLADGVRRADEDNPNGYYEWEPVKRLREDGSWLPDARGKAVKMVYLLLYDLPATHSYRVLFLRRDLGEVIASQRAMLRRQGKAEVALDDAQLAAVFRTHLQRVDAWLRGQKNFAVLDVDYATTLRDPGRAAAEIGSFLGGPLEAAAMAAVCDRSLHRQRRGPAAGAVGEGRR